MRKITTNKDGYCNYCGHTQKYCNCLKIFLKAKKEVFEDIDNLIIARDGIKGFKDGEEYQRIKKRHLPKCQLKGNQK